MGNQPQIALVTGYIPIQGHPRSAKDYGELGENMFGKLSGDFYIHPFYEGVDQTWLFKTIWAWGKNVSHSVADNPQKNSLAYHCVQHQKFEWLLRAKQLSPKTKMFVWIDYGIGYLPGVTPDVVMDFMASIKLNDFAIPGCIEREGLVINDYWPCWRFCGGVMVVPANKVYQLYKGIKTAVAKHIEKTNNISWEVNSLARAEPNLPPIRWYKADHNETMFTNYSKGLHNEQG